MMRQLVNDKKQRTDDPKISVKILSEGQNRKKHISSGR